MLESHSMQKYIFREKGNHNPIRAILNWSRPVAVTDLGDANSRFLGLVFVGHHDH